MRRIVACLATLVVLTVSAQASAQVYAGEDEDQQILYITSTSTTSTAVAVGMIVGTVVTVQEQREDAMLEDYLRKNDVAVARAIRFGAGDSVDDLAAFLDVSDDERASFGRALRLASKTLVELARPERLDRARAGRFLDTVRFAHSVVRLSQARS